MKFSSKEQKIVRHQAKRVVARAKRYQNKKVSSFVELLWALVDLGEIDGDSFIDVNIDKQFAVNELVRWSENRGL
jgi:hypothetical protein